MNPIHYPPAALSLFIVVRPEPLGQFTAQAVGLPEVRATAATREEALQQVRATLAEWIASGQLVALPIPPAHALQNFSGWIDPDDPGEKVFLEEMARLKAEDLERTLREYAEEDQRCSGSSSTPTT